MLNVQRQISPIELELERVRKFSIIDCIRNEVNDVINKLPKESEEKFQKKIDEVIRQNLLKERKVRFGNSSDRKDESDRMALEEIEVILQVLGNDRNNKLVIENFDLLETRIKSVEQRLSGFLRKVPDINKTNRLSVRIDPQRIKANIQDFVNMFNHVFTSTYEVLTNTNSSLMDETMSSKNRLKFHLLAHLKELKKSESDLQSNTQQQVQSASNNAARFASGKFGTRNFLKKSESKIEIPVVKAVDSLIKLRQRFKGQSGKLRDIKGNKKPNEAENQVKKPPPKKNTDVVPKRKEEWKSARKIKEKGLSEENLCSKTKNVSTSCDTTDDFDLEYIEKAINESLRRGSRELKDSEKKNEYRLKRKPILHGSQHLKSCSQELSISDTSELIKSYVNKTVLRKSNVLPNAKEKLNKTPPRYISTNRIDTQSEVRKTRLTNITNKYGSVPKIETLFEKFPSRLGTGLQITNQNVLTKEKILTIKPRYNITKLDRWNEQIEESLRRKSRSMNILAADKPNESIRQNTAFSGLSDSTDTLVPIYRRNILPDETPNSTPVYNSAVEIVAKYTGPCIKLLEEHREEIPLNDVTTDSSPCTDFEDISLKDEETEKTCTTQDELVLKENKILDSLFANIEDKIAKATLESVGDSYESRETDEDDLLVALKGIKEGSSSIKDVPTKELKTTTEREKSMKGAKTSSANTTPDKDNNRDREKDKLTKQIPKRNTIPMQQMKERQVKEVKKPEKPKPKDLLPKSKDTNVTKFVKTKLNTFRKEQQPGSVKANENRTTLYKQRAERKNFYSSIHKDFGSRTSGSSIDVVSKKSSNISSDTFSKTSLSLLSELKLQRSKSTRSRPVHRKTIITQQPSTPKTLD